ncbi:uncharacterized protein CC84DRAFT_1180971 [Paraphaeosphaeria sporulosa]|uniref:Uncharacterized protein n=1 Tax=Paraphaeosphaeria sporulosa TaxID=1460663 RepID=A0A177BXD6_9PLEO|nr:uncharacterized protein CC84DRAFT_1180971 [Paraphaeosphaeria sporulosa]OAG00174.1 hypothetical protein CC84DRAFT_1180971 [Paraphaeosphaeria sporulosa]
MDHWKWWLRELPKSRPANGDVGIEATVEEISANSLLVAYAGVLDEHVENLKFGGRCGQYSAQDLAVIMRDLVEMAMKKDGEPPAIFDVHTMELLRGRVYSNFAQHINGSDTREKTAPAELWKWYLIFKQLQPDAKVPWNPFFVTRVSQHAASLLTYRIRVAYTALLFKHCKAADRKEVWAPLRSCRDYVENPTSAKGTFRWLAPSNTCLCAK